MMVASIDYKSPTGNKALPREGAPAVVLCVQLFSVCLT